MPKKVKSRLKKKRAKKQSVQKLTNKKVKSRLKKKRAKKRSVQKLTKLSDPETAKRFQKLAQKPNRDKFSKAWERGCKHPGEELPKINKTDAELLEQAIESAISTSPQLTPEQVGNWLIKSNAWPPNAAAEVSKRFWLVKMQSPTQEQLEEAKTRLLVEIKALFTACPEIESWPEKEYQLLVQYPRPQTQENRFTELQKNLPHFRRLQSVKARASTLDIDFQRLKTKVRKEFGESAAGDTPPLPPDWEEKRTKVTIVKAMAILKEYTDKGSKSHVYDLIKKKILKQPEPGFVSTDSLKKHIFG